MDQRVVLQDNSQMEMAVIFVFYIIRCSFLLNIDGTDSANWDFILLLYKNNNTTSIIFACFEGEELSKWLIHTNQINTHNLWQETSLHIIPCQSKSIMKHVNMNAPAFNMLAGKLDVIFNRISPVMKKCVKYFLKH